MECSEPSHCFFKNRIVRARCTPGKKLKELLKTAKELDLAALVEVHSLEELKRALAANAKIIGINNRNLKDFSVDIKLTEKLLNLIPGRKEKITLSESGIKTRSNVEYLL